MPETSPKTRPRRFRAILLLGAGLALAAFGGIALAGVTTGGGPGLELLSAGSAPQPPPPSPPQPPSSPPQTTPPPVVSAPDVPEPKVRGKRRVRNPRPIFRFRTWLRGATFVCRIGDREETRTVPCARSFKVPNVGPGRHVLVVQTIDADGNRSGWVKFVYFVIKPKR